MIRTTFSALALLAAVPLATPATAQATTQEEIEARYDRALAAGYKALFLCSAIANAERNGATRTEEGILEWELSGIQSPLDSLISELDHTVHRFAGEEGAVSHVSVDWNEDMPPRIAWHRQEGGCSVAPIGTEAPPERETVPYSQYGDSSGRPVQFSPALQNRELIEVTKRAFGESYGENTRTTAVIVDQQGSTPVSRYAGFSEFNMHTPQRTWSVAKSLAATLVGAAVLLGDADISKSAGLGETDDDPRRGITIDHALRMASGRYSDTPGNRTDPLYFGGATVDEVAVDWPLVSAPGTVFRYANNDTLAAVQAIEETFSQHPPAEFLKAVGMNDNVAETDWQGNYILSSQVWSTARDLAKLGQLYLNDGVLPDGTRILPEGWAEYVATPSGPQPDGPFGYGAGFWLFNKSDGIPPDTYAAMGNRGQFIVIVPSMNTVIVRRGEDPAGYRFDIAAFTRDVLETLQK